MPAVCWSALRPHGARKKTTTTTTGGLEKEEFPRHPSRSNESPAPVQNPWLPEPEPHLSSTSHVRRTFQCWGWEEADEGGGGREGRGDAEGGERAFGDGGEFGREYGGGSGRSVWRLLMGFFSLKVFCGRECIGPKLRRGSIKHQRKTGLNQMKKKKAIYSICQTDRNHRKKPYEHLLLEDEEFRESNNGLHTD
ncbi:hypothetical protein MRB53_015812 [Persea americana]|uniref:Uncharacterized protein n=1 Tax=Persea americana TaxID=3435 RepID=A0ACC2M0Y1_PERAE|nr:hypothetical protein MRB53_015812 [Persea americana]